MFNRMTLFILLFHINSIIATPLHFQAHNNEEYYYITPQVFHAAKEFPKLNITGHESIIDIGCRTGDITAFIAHSALTTGKIHGIDNSLEAITRAQEAHNINGLSFEHASYMEYEPQEEYDIALCFWTLYTTQDYAQALKKIVNLVKPGGHILIAHIISPGTPFLQLYQEVIAPLKLPFNLPDFKTITQAVAAAPVKIESFEIKTNCDIYQNRLRLKEAMDKIPFFNTLTDEQNQRLMQRLQDLYPVLDEGWIYDHSQIVSMLLQRVE